MNLCELAFKFFIFALLLRFLNYLFWNYGYPLIHEGLNLEKQTKNSLQTLILSDKKILSQELLCLEQQKLDLADLQRRINLWKDKLAVKQQRYLDENLILDKKYAEKKIKKVMGHCIVFKATVLYKTLWENKLKIREQVSAEVANEFFKKRIALIGV